MCGRTVNPCELGSIPSCGAKYFNNRRTTIIKSDAIKSILEMEEIELKLKSKPLKIKYVDLLETLSKREYSLVDSLKVNVSTVTRTLKYLWPDRPVDSTKVCTWLLHKYGFKHCPNCVLVKPLEDFHSNASSKTGVNTHCKDCCLLTRGEYQRHYQANRRADKILRTPSWADLEKIKEIYSKCPEGFHVDHIIPLKGVLVSGLHVENNLQYLPALDNIKKRNTFKI